MQRSPASFIPEGWSARSSSPSPTAKKSARANKLERPSKLDDAVLRDARVLIVEDDFLILIELETILREVGAQIAGACRTVDEALAVASDSDMDAALLDLRLGQD